MFNYRLLLLIFTAACVPTFLGYTQTTDLESEIVTDRPDFTESAVVVPTGAVQFEGGGTLELGPRADDNFTLPELLLRWSFRPRVELRLGLPDYIKFKKAGGPAGFGDSSIGAKVQFGPLAGDWDLAGILTLSLPSGHDDLTSDTVDPELIIVAGRELNAAWSLGTQLVLASASEDDHRRFVWGGTVVLSTSLSDKIGSFGELAVTIPEEGTAFVLLHHGYSYLVNSTLQLDLHGGVGFTDSAPDFFLGAGLSNRF
ncbi:MAG: transporter [bacterium]